jgi:hypothetical protein
MLKFGGTEMNKIYFKKPSALLWALIWMIVSIIPATAQDNGNIAPDQIPGVAVYIPYPVDITLDGNLDDWEGIPVQRVDTAVSQSPDPNQNQYLDFSVAADEDNLYVYMFSEDSNIIAGQHEGNFWNEDSMEFYVNFSDDLNARDFSPGIAQININGTNIDNSSVSDLSLSGTNVDSYAVRAKVFETANGWAFEAAIPLGSGNGPSHGKTIGFQVQANGATQQDRDSKIIWSKLDTGDESYNNPAVFGRAMFFEIGRTDIPVLEDMGKDLGETFIDEGATGRASRELVWADEFDYRGEPDRSKWAYAAADAGKYNNELQSYTTTRANSRVRRGNLTIRALRDDNGRWTSARLNTQFREDWTYGYFEIRAKLPAGRGTWPAIWMMPTNETYGGWPSSGEIDIMEFVGLDPDIIHTSVHTEIYNHRIDTQKTRAAMVENVCDEFHTYAVEWTPDGLFFYVDDEPFYFFLNEDSGYRAWPFDKPFYIILNVAMGGDWGGMNGMDPDLDEAEMLVDYVRVYQ